MNEYINTTETKNILKVTPQTLRTWAKENKIRSVRTPSNQRLYHKQDVYDLVGIDITSKKKKKILYCRVSSKKQMDDLERQKNFLRSKYRDHIMVTDIGSGINWERKGLKTILEQSLHGNVEEIVVAHRDRLCRFAFELIEFILQQTGCKLVVHDEEHHKSADEELAEDLLSIIHVYSCRNMGRRRYSKQKISSVSIQGSEQDDETMDGDYKSCIQ